MLVRRGKTISDTRERQGVSSCHLISQRLLANLIEKLPLADGSLRRRFIAGGIITLFAILFFVDPKQVIQAMSQENAAKLFSSTIFGFIALGLIYATGGLIELIGEGFILRGVGEAARQIEQAKAKTKDRKTLVRYLWKLLFPFYVYGVPFFFVQGFIRGTTYEIRFQHEHLSQGAVDAFQGLPEKVREGLRHPLGDYLDLGLLHIEGALSEDRKKLFRSSVRRNKELLSTLSAVFLVVMMLPVYIQIQAFQNTQMRYSQTRIETPKEGSGPMGTLVENADLRQREIIIAQFFILNLAAFSMFFAALLVRGYFVKLRSCIYTGLELIALDRPVPQLAVAAA